MGKKIVKALHINYFSNNSWGYKIWNAINDAENRNSDLKLPKNIHNELGSTMLGISYRLDSMPLIIQRINKKISVIYDLVRKRNKSKDMYAFQGISPEVIFSLLIDVNSFIYELRSCCELTEKLIKRISRHYKKYSSGTFKKELPNKLWLKSDWYGKLRKFREEIFHGSAPYVDIDISNEPQYDLLFPLENIHDYSQSNQYFRFSDVEQIRKGFGEGIVYLQDYIVEKIEQLK